MKKNSNRRLRLNLATRPLRNRRLFFLIFSLLLLFLAVILVNGLRIYVTYFMKSADVEESLKQVETVKRETQKEEKKLIARIEEAKVIHGKKVNFINSLLVKKSFSWTVFLTHLEQTLPRGSYVTRLNPVFREEDLQMEVRLTLSSRHLTDLLTFIEDLEAAGCRDIRVVSETRDQRMFYVSEVTFFYERNI